jgi:NADP-dependent aldehyde dehydrogenase
VLTSYDARTGLAVGDPVEETDPHTLDATVRAAAAAATTWRSSDSALRSGALRGIADALDAGTDQLVAIADTETALGAPRLSGEVARTSAQLRMFADLVDEGSYVDAVISPATAARPDVRRMQWPIGPVGVFSASNFPFAFSVAGGDTASALAVGCPVVVKAHEGHPATSRAVASVLSRALTDAGAPAGIFGIVFGVEAGRQLVVHPAIKAIGFTGSAAGGRALFDLASGRSDPIPFYGELGSVNPVVVLPHADAAHAAALASGYVGSLTMGVGQFCTNPNLLFVPDGSRIPALIADALPSASGGPMLGSRVHAAYDAALTDLKWTALDLVGSGPTTDGPWVGRPEVRHAPLTAIVGHPEVFDVERFGPAGLVVGYDDIEALLAVLGGMNGTLTASIHAEDEDASDADRVATTLSRVAGRLIMNGWPTGVAVCWAMHHGGPWPATTSAGHTSVGGTALRRWLAPVAYQNFPDALLPAPLRSDNPLNIVRITEPG